MMKQLKFFLRPPVRLYRAAREWLVSTFLSIKVTVAFPLRKKPRKHLLPSQLIVSLTSYPARFSSLHLTLKCLLSQTVAPDKLILWIAHQDKAALTSNILKLQSEGLVIAYCDDLKSYKKIIPTLQQYPDSFIVTADDDVYYWPTWLDELLREYRGGNEVIGHRAHRIRLGGDGYPLPYLEWELETTNMSSSPLNFLTGVGGIFYPPYIFHPDVLKVDLFEKLCPRADDVWLYWMTRLNGARLRLVAAKKRRLHCWPSSQKQALWRTNVLEDGNDLQIRAMIDAYGRVYVESN